VVGRAVDDAGLLASIRLSRSASTTSAAARLADGHTRRRATSAIRTSAARLNVLAAERRKWAKVDQMLAAARRSRAARVIAAADAVLAGWLPRAGWHRPEPRAVAT
jgi:hypothetical protein